MRLPQKGTRAKKTPEDEPIELNHFPMLVPEGGYRWLDDAVPPPELGTENANKLGEAPHMVVNGKYPVAARRHFPLLEFPDLFLRFGELELDRDSILKFANRYGWIGETGWVRVGTRPSVPAIGICRWHEEIQAMIMAHHLWESVENCDEHRLRNYLTWHRSEFNVEFRIGTQKRKILTKHNPMVAGPSSLRGARPLKVELQWLINPNHEESLRAIGWKRGDMLGPARIAVMNFVNPRLAAHCHPRLYLDSRGRLIGHLTPNNLLGGIWLQFYQTILGQLKLRLCTVCKLQMDVTESRSTKRKHERCAKRERMRRYRSKRRSHPQGKRHPK
jgi:hypothetical protein